MPCPNWIVKRNVFARFLLFINKSPMNRLNNTHIVENNITQVNKKTIYTIKLNSVLQLLFKIQ
jgi:hypothetical protein